MATPVSASPAPSPFDAARQAIELARRRLFPFRFERWLALGFVAFLDQCGRGGGGNGGYAPGWLTDSARVPGGAALPGWLDANLTWVVGMAAVVLALIVAIVALVLFINSRGIFMYLDNVVSGRSDVARPWREHKALAASLFAWRFGIAAATLAGVLVLGGFAALLFFMVRRGQLAYAAALAVALLTLLPPLLLLVLGATLLSLALRDFVAPIQLARGASCGEAIPVFWGLLKANLGTFLVYALLKLVFAIALGIAMLLVGCLTCCVGFLPVVAQTALQPALYFERAWSLYLLKPLGVDLLREQAPPTSAPPPLPLSGPSSPTLLSASPPPSSEPSDP